MSQFTCVYEEPHGYTDFQMPIPDHNGIGGFVGITLNDWEEDGPPSAYGVIQFDTPDGQELLHEEFKIDRALAERLVGR